MIKLSVRGCKILNIVKIQFSNIRLTLVIDKQDQPAGCKYIVNFFEFEVFSWRLKLGYRAVR